MVTNAKVKSREVIELLIKKVESLESRLASSSSPPSSINPTVAFERSQLDALPLNFRLQNMQKFKPFVDEPSHWIRTFEDLVISDNDSSFSFVSSALKFFTPDVSRPAVQQMIDSHSAWSGLRQSFIAHFTRVDPFVRLVDEVLNLRQERDEPPMAYFERLTGILAKGEMVDTTVDSKWVKLLLSIGIRPELLEGLRRYIHLPLRDIDKNLTTETYAKRLDSKQVDAHPSATSTPMLQFSVTDQPALSAVTRQVQSNPDDKVDHTIQAFNTSQQRNMLCFHCGKAGHRIAECRTRLREMAQSTAQQPSGAKKRFHPYKKQKFMHKRNGNYHNNTKSDDEDDEDDDEDNSASHYKKGHSKSGNGKPNKKAIKAFHGAHNYTVSEQATPIDVGPTSELMYVRVSIAGKMVNALVDTGATVSILNTRIANVKPDRTLFSGRVWINTAVRGMRSEALGYAKLPVKFSVGNHVINHKFLLSTTSKEDVILGLDFLRENSFVVDPSARTLIKKSAREPQLVISTTTKQSELTLTNLDAQQKAGEQKDQTRPPVEKTRPPVEKTRPPVEKTRPPVEKTKPPVEKARPMDVKATTDDTKVKPLTPSHSVPSREYQLFAEHGVTILPGLTQTVDLRCKVPLQPGFYASRDNQSNTNRQTFIAEQILEIPHAQTIQLKVTILNNSMFLVTIRAGERLATLDAITEVIQQTGMDVNTAAAENEQVADLSHLSVQQQRALSKAIQQNKQAFYQADTDLRATHLTQHQIHVKDGSDPVFVPQYPLAFAHQDVVKKLVLDMLKAKIVEPTRSAYNSPIILVKKHDGTWRFVTDFRRLNDATIPDRFPLARQDDIFRELQGMHYYTTVDLKQGFWQIEILPEHRSFTAFSVAGLGQFQYCRLPFGLSNSPATFCRVVTTAISGSANLFEEQDRKSIARAYVDDIIIASKDFDSHVTHINIILQAIHHANLTINPSKCSWAKQEIKFLGHIVAHDGIRIDPERVKRIAAWQAPVNRRALLRFIGFVNYCRAFVPRFGAICNPLYALTSKAKEFLWEKQHQDAFEKLKLAMQDTRTLAIPQYNGRPFLIECDASNTGIGAALLQEQDDGSFRPIAYAGRALKTQEINYGISEKECLAMVYSLQEFNVFIEGHRVEIKTDHAALTWLQEKVRLGNRRLQLWSLVLQKAFPKIKYSPGETMILADALSRCDAVEDPEGYLAQQTNPIPTNTQQHFVNSLNVVQQNFCDGQREDKNIREIIDFLLLESLPTDKDRRQRVRQQAPYYHIERELLYKKNKLVVPQPMRKKLIAEAHDSPFGGHLSEGKTLSRLQAYFWQGIGRDVRQHLNACTSCNGFKPKTGQIKPRLVDKVPDPYEPFSEVNIDLITNLPKSRNGNQHILTVTDKMSRWVEAYPLPDLTAAAVANAILKEFVCRYGAPIRISSDRGSNFTAELMNKVVKIINSEQQFSPAYCPWINGSVERMNGTLVRMLRHYINQEQDDWDEKLPFVLFAYRSSVSRTTGSSPFRLVFGREARGPTEASIKASETSAIKGNPDEATSYAARLSATLTNAWTHAKVVDTSYRQSNSESEVTPQLSNFAVGDRVWIYQPDTKSKSKKFAEDWVPGWVIRSVISPQIFIVQRGDGSGRADIRTVHAARVKPYTVQKESADVGNESDTNRKRKAVEPKRSDARSKRKTPVHNIMDKIVAEAIDDAGRTYYVTRWFGLTSEDDTLEPEKTFMVSGGIRSPILTKWLKMKKREQQELSHKD